MSTYWDTRFLSKLNNIKIQTVFEVGARYGDESIKLSEIFSNAIIHSFECNPLTLNICKNRLQSYSNIRFNDYGLGIDNEELPFFSFTQNNDGASSLLKRIDFSATQKETGSVKLRKLEDYISENDIKTIDLLCMDVQGYELNVLKGAGELINCIKYIIIEEPKEKVDPEYLPVGIHSKYIGAPTAGEIKEFFRSNNFIEIERIEENKLEDNVMYKNLMYN